jgi:cell cycle checkpoint protein
MKFGTNDTLFDRPKRECLRQSHIYAPTCSEDLCVAPKKVQKFRQWLEESSSSGGLLILIGNPGIGKSTMVQLFCPHRHEWVEEPSSTSPLQSFLRFLDQSNYLESHTFVVIDELPHLHTQDMQQTFRNAMAQHVLRCIRKTIWIYSNTIGGTHQPKDLEVLLDPQILYHSGLVQFLHINPVTNTRMKQILKPLCDHYQISLPDVTIFQGDIRHAIMSLRTYTSHTDSRDIRWSPFHALGKLLYAKRNLHGSLEFDPENVVEQSGMPWNVSLFFLQSHAPDFFTDVCELTKTLDHYSDAASINMVSFTIQSRSKYTVLLSKSHSTTSHKQILIVTIIIMAAIGELCHESHGTVSCCDKSSCCTHPISFLRVATHIQCTIKKY